VKATARQILPLISLAVAAEERGYMPEGSTMEGLRRLLMLGEIHVSMIRLNLTDLLCALPPGAGLWTQVRNARDALPYQAPVRAELCPCGQPLDDHLPHQVEAHTRLTCDGSCRPRGES
jgi:hypothetical protein